jgi:hypothetical protein
VLVLTGKASEAVQMINSGIAAHRSTGAILWVPLYLSLLGIAYAELHQFDDAWRCVDEALTLIEKTKERWCEAEVGIAGEIMLNSPERDATKAAAYFERALDRRGESRGMARVRRCYEVATGYDRCILHPGRRLPRRAARPGRGKTRCH